MYRLKFRMQCELRTAVPFITLNSYHQSVRSICSSLISYWLFDFDYKNSSINELNFGSQAGEIPSDSLNLTLYPQWIWRVTCVRPQNARIAVNGLQSAFHIWIIICGQCMWFVLLISCVADHYVFSTSTQTRSNMRTNRLFIYRVHCSPCR